MSAAAIKTLRKAVNRPKIEEATAVRFKVTFGAREGELISTPGQSYMYGAIFVNNFWYLTSQRETSTLDDGSVIRPRMSQRDFEQVLGSSQVSEVAVATEWVTL